MATIVNVLDGLFQLTDEGLKTPTYVEINDLMIQEVKSVFGEDIYLDPDSKLRQYVDVVSLRLYEVCNAISFVRNEFDPDFCSSDALNRLAPINGITRREATNSTCDVVLSGTVGTTIIDGTVKDKGGNIWILPTPITIPESGTITVTATAEEVGAITANIGDINTINNPQRGWQSVINTTAGTTGQPVETDTEFRLRRELSVALPARCNMESIIASVANVEGVINYKGYENDTGETDSNGLPEHSICCVVYGGDSTKIAEAIRIKKAPGVLTWGGADANNVTIPTIDAYGTPQDISFRRPTLVHAEIRITIQTKQGWTQYAEFLVKKALAERVDLLTIGDSFYLSEIIAEVQKQCGYETTNRTYYVTKVETRQVGGSTWAESGFAIAYDQLLMLDAESHVSFIIL